MDLKAVIASAREAIQSLDNRQMGCFVGDPVIGRAFARPIGSSGLAYSDVEIWDPNIAAQRGATGGKSAAVLLALLQQNRHVSEMAGRTYDAG